MIDAGPLFRLDGQTALVTGAGSGLGREIALAFAAAGASVVAADRDAPAAEAVAAGSEAIEVAVFDVRDAAAVEDRIGALGRLDVLVNSAGVSGSWPTLEHSDEDWERILETNLTATFRVCRAAGRLMVPARSGSIVNIASDLGLAGAPAMAAYVSSKGGVVQLTRGLALEWARHGVRVNALAPSTFETELVRRQRELDPERFARYETTTPIGRFGRPEEIAGPALFLASRASSMVTGHVLAVDGGYLAQ